MSEAPSKRKDIGGLWQRETRSGETFFSGVIELNGEKTNVIIFGNRYKSENPKGPDYRIFLSDDNGPASAPAPKKAKQPARRTPAPVEEFEDDDEGLL